MREGDGKQKSYEPVLGVMSLDGKPVITHDDRLLLRAQKHKLGLWDNWRAGTKIARMEGEPIIVMWHHVDDVTRTVAEPPPGEEGWWAPQFERVVPMEGVRVSLKFNQTDIELLDLQNDLRSRYRKALEVMADMERRGVVRYVPRTGEPSERNILEALRHRMRRYAKVTTYEHNLLFRGELGAKMLELLRPHDRAPEPYEGTVYLKGWRRYDGLQVSVKFYSVTKREGLAEEPGGLLHKLETTFHKAYFKAHGLRDVSSFIEQPDIQEILFLDLLKHVSSVLRLLATGGFDMEQFELGLDRKASAQEVARVILKRELTLTERVEALERQTREHAERLEVIERHLRRRKAKRDDTRS